MAHPTKNLTPDRPTRARVAAHAGLDLRSVDNYLSGRTKAHPLTVRAIHDAARALGVELNTAGVK